jgi:chitin synthase
VYHYVNIVLNYVYIGLLLLCFLLALGNRPQGYVDPFPVLAYQAGLWDELITRSVIGYTLSMVGFAILTAYMLFAAGQSFIPMTKHHIERRQLSPLRMS